jgi:hypothetical protein
VAQIAVDSARFCDYNVLRELPRYVEKSIEEGYEIVHKAPLCWIPMSSASLEPKLRLLLVALEAMFAYMLWAMRTPSRDYGMAHICLWDRSDLEWDGLCSHCSLFEGIPGDFGLTAEEIEALSAEKVFARALGASETGREWDRDQRENNRDEFLEKRRESRAALAARSPERLRKEHREWREKRYEAKKLYCETCKMTFATPSAMEIHNATPTHLNKAEEMKRRYTCIPCAYGANRKDTFNTHLKTKRHSKMVAYQSSSSELD